MRLVPLLACSCLLWGLCGCGNGGQTSTRTDAVDVFIEGGGKFPSWLAGRWRGNSNNWEIVFEPDGRILSANHGIGGVLVRANHLTTVRDPDKQSENTFKAGQWSVHYLPDERELRVEIVLDEVHLEWGPLILNGKVKDYFVGKISEDGKVWQADWFTFPEYTTPGHESTVLAPKSDEVFAGTIIFEKVADESTAVEPGQ